MAVVAHRKPHLLQHVDRGLVALDIGEQGNVIAVPATREMRLDPRTEIAIGAGLAQFGGVVLVGIEIGFRRGHHRLLRRQRTRLFEGRSQFAGLDLGRLDIRLVERIDAEDRAGHSGCDLEAEELLADMVDRLQDDADHGMPGMFERGELLVMRGVVLALGAQIDEETIVAVK